MTLTTEIATPAVVITMTSPSSRKVVPASSAPLTYRLPIESPSSKRPPPPPRCYAKTPEDLERWKELLKRVSEEKALYKAASDRLTAVKKELADFEADLKIQF
ncbi:hypothetical protein LZ554_002955 [Drepanopeziza brunnea f. sp. 'monogermtubi']|nr:hypothetical protein LZ554_002955 [Drepanopeziza brunnea f. sp. 'monogermtubi']